MNKKFQLKSVEYDDLELNLKALSDLAFENSNPTDQNKIANIVKNIDVVFAEINIKDDVVFLEAEEKLISKFKDNYNKLVQIAKKTCKLDDFAMEDIKNLTTEIDSYIKKSLSPTIEYTNPRVDKTGLFILNDVIVDGKNISKISNKQTASQQTKIK